MRLITARRKRGALLSEVTVYAGLGVMMLGFLLKVVLNMFYEGDVYGQTARRCLYHAIEDNGTPDDAVGVGGYMEMGRGMGSVGSSAGIDIKRFSAGCFASVGTRLTLNYAVGNTGCSSEGLGVGKHFASSSSDNLTGRQGDLPCATNVWANRDMATETIEGKFSETDSNFASAGGVITGSNTTEVTASYTTSTNLGGTLSSSVTASGGTSGESTL